MIHLQSPVPGWLEPVRKLPTKSLVKSLDNGQVFREVKSIAAEQGKIIYTCLRHHYDRGQVFGGDYETNKQRARVFLATFIDDTFKNDIAPYCDYVEEWNEYLANSQNEAEIEDRVRWARAVADVWKNEYRNSDNRLAHIKLVLCNTAIGNWINKRFAEVAQQFDCAIGYHPYTLWENKVRWGEDEPLDDGYLDTLDWINLSGLWDSMEFDWNIKVDWVFTEAGPFQSAVDGWRSSHCLGGDEELYVQAVKDWIRDVQQTPAYKEDRIKGFALFTTDNQTSGTWGSYLTYTRQLNMLADMIAVEWNPGQGNIPDPGPTPPPTSYAYGIDISRWQGTMNWDVTAQQVDFAIFKATEGNSWRDPQFQRNAEEAVRVNIPVRGPYHFFVPYANGSSQAANFLANIEGTGFNILAVDVEQGPVNHGELLLFINVVKETYPGIRFLLYTSPGFYNSYLTGTDWSKHAFLWIAHWNVNSPLVPLPYETWTLWQYTNAGDGHAYGAGSTRIDLDVYNGSRDELLYWVQDTQPPIQNIRTLTNAKLRTKPYYTGQRGEDTYILTVPKGTLLLPVGQVDGEEYQGSTVWKEVAIWHTYNTGEVAVAKTAFIHSALTELA